MARAHAVASILALCAGGCGRVGFDAAARGDAGPRPDAAADGGAATDAGPDAGVSMDPDAGPLDADAGPMGGAGRVCTDATRITLGFHRDQTTVGFGDESATTETCGPGDGPDRFYAVEVPPGDHLVAWVIPRDAWDPTLAISLGCAEPLACVDGRDLGAVMEMEWAEWTNEFDLARTAFIRVDAFDLEGEGPFDLFVRVETPGTAERCDGAEPLAPGVTVTSDTFGFANDLDSVTCEGVGGGDRYYAITVPDGQRLEATLTALDGSYDPSLHVVRGASCVAASCVATADATLGGETETVRWDNTSGGAAPVYVVVDGFSDVDVGPFTLRTTLTPIR